MAMERSSYTNSLPFLLFLLPLLPSIAEAQYKSLNKKSLNKKGFNISALFVFGDSTVDPGNNNYLTTLFKSNFPPYGRDYSKQQPTGRFCNGRLVTDFVASYLGLKDEIPPYLDTGLSFKELTTGVSFASAGSGYDPLTPKISMVMEIPKQVDYFRDYLRRMQLMIGKTGTEELIGEAGFLISAGTNDFIVNYFTLPEQRKKYTVQEYQLLLLQKLGEFLQDLKDLGARRILVAGLPPIGCLPIVITANPHYGFQNRGCFDTFNYVAVDYNRQLQNKLVSMQETFFPDGRGRIVYVDIYNPLLDMMLHPGKFGFEDSVDGCCGTGLFEASFLCNPTSLVCPDASKYVFWDSIHPTEKTYYLVFKTLGNTINHFLLD
ncbi:GDSL esterase/lipase At5g45960-like [Tasmannia lanceolata]|uniref:GDSL esterase/lipase At5g45960-like n=1 Tax=Tasmannia lanceolata TaxID=3420 RepID=UPI0040649B9D